NEWWIGTDGEGVQKLTLPDNNPENYTIQKLAPETMLAYESVQSLFEDENDQLWVSTFGNGVFRISLQNEPAFINYNKSNGLSNNFIKEVFKDLEGNIWIGSYGSGLELMLNEAFTFYPGDNVTGVAVTNDFIWMAKENVLEGMPNDPQDEKITYTTRNGLPDDKITALFAADDGSLWIGYEGSGIYILKNNSISKFYLANNSLSNTINHITGKNGKMWISTNNGVYIIYPDGSKKNLTTQETLPHNSIAQVYLDSKGRAWVATKTNALYYIENDVVAEQRYSINGPEVEIKCILEDESDGSIWAASYGGGVFHFMGDSVINLTTNTGLKSNFCYSFIQDIKGNIWIGHRFGFSRINHTDRIIDTYGPEDGFTGDCNYNAVDEGESGKIYFGTTHGMVRYNPENDEINTTPPFLNITQAYLNDEPIELGRELKLPYGIYKLRIDFIGLNYQAPEKVVYEYMLKGEGFDSEFGQPTASNSVTYPNLRDGNYQFILRSYNKDGVSNEVPVIVEIDIKQPFWKAWWFILLCIFAVVVLVYAIIKYRERKQKQLQEYLETQLELRTKEVVEQKEEIEIKNRDITDSINYAQRIQASILPSMRRLQDNFSGSFVFYQPRDIVSGDFYWFDNVKDNKFVIVCADSTGHGVPGAFMSMIGTTLIKDICMREDVNSPAEILFMLDNELKNTLNQNIDAERSNDGMDIIVCEVDITTNYMRFASAMRPMIIYKDGEEIYLKGSRSSVGGHMHKEDKDFEEQGFQLNKGDIVYMFSDGYPDQFGGPMGKKFKMVRLRNLMKEMYQKPMELQFEMVRNTFNDWKSDEEQVDDVLFMGLKI
ncbi:MAG: SpoIIE family protein phosphatase, partial [Bacteroidota bacterium]